MANFFAKYPINGGSGGVPIYATFAAFPSGSQAGDLAVAADTGILYEWNGSAWAPIASPGGALSVGTFDSQAPVAQGLQIVSTVLYAQSATALFPGMVNTSTQTFAGNKTFTGTIGASNLSGTNTGDVTLGTANGLSLVGQALSLALSSTSTVGALSAADWNTFNGKQASGNYITALTGDGTAAGPGSVALTLATVNSNVGSFGSATQVTALTVNAKGLVTAAASTSIQIAESQVTNLVSDLAGKQPVGNYITALTGDATAAGPGSVALTLATVNSNVGSFGSSTAIPSFTVNAKGLITAASTNVVIAPAGTLTGTTLASNVVTSSLTALGTIVTGVWNGTTIAIANGGTGQTSKAAAFDALSPMTTAGDIIYGGASGTGTRLAAGTTGQLLGNSGGTPAWVNGPQMTTSAKTTTYAILTTDNVITYDCSGGTFTTTLPTAVGVTGKTYTLIRTNQTASVAVTIATTSAQTIGAFGSGALTLDIRGEALTVISDGANWQIKYWYTPQVTYTITIGGPAGWSTTYSVGMVIKSYGVWRLIFNFKGTKTSAANATINVTGFVFDSQRQSISGNDNSGGSAPSNVFTDGGTNQIAANFAAATTDIDISGNVQLNAKPTIAM
jgi:hypothetical protein